MLNLIRKDLLMHKTGIPVYVPIVVGVMVLQAWRGFSPSVYITLICIYAIIVPTALMAIEDRVRAGIFNCSLPVTRRQIVLAKYVIAWVLAVVAVVTGLAIYSVVAAPNLGDIWTLAAAIQSLAILALGLGLTLPVLLRFGWMGMMISYFGLMTVVAVTVVIVLALVPGRQLLDSFIAISDWVANAVLQLGELNCLMLIIVVGAILNLVSFIFGTKMFQRRAF